MKKFLAIVALSAATATTASAQLRVGPEVGLNLSSITTKFDGNSNSSDMKIGARIGVVADIALSSNLYLRPGIQFAMMGGKESVDIPATPITPAQSFSSTINLNYIQVPVNILYKFGQEGGGRFYIGLTPYVGFGIGGTAKIEDEKVEDYEAFGDEGVYKALDFGAGLKVGYELPMGLYVDAGYMMGVTNNLNGGDSDNKATNGNFTIGVGFLFGGSRY